jgi:type VI secretion system protein ImpF
MSRAANDTRVIPSVLDRLISNTGSETAGYHQVLRELKQSVRRDLENLLNTRWRCKSFPPDYEELEVSLMNYGIPDLTNANLGVAQNREEFRRIIEKAIRKFEPRFKSVSVHLVPSPDRFDRTMRFRIDAMLHAEPDPEPVTFDSAVEPSTFSFKVL